MAEKTNANIGFEKQLWDAACVLWGHIPAAEYRKVIIGLIFLRYISAAFDKRDNELIAEGDGFEDDPDAYTSENVFFVPEEARWSTIAAAAHTPEIGTVIDSAMRAIEEDKPPFNYHPWGQEKLLDDVRWKYGIPPAGNANYAWIQHMIHHLKPTGKIGLVLANGALSTQTSGEGDIRRRIIIEDDLIEGIIAMPTQLFYSVTIPVTLWFITKGKKQKGKTLFIDARKMGHMVDRKHRDFTDENIQRLADTFEAFQNGTLTDEKGFCAVATLQDIANQDYILTPGRYVGIEEQEDDGEPFEEKMTRLTSELSDMFKKSHESHELEEEIREKLGAIGYEI